MDKESRYFEGDIEPNPVKVAFEGWSMDYFPGGKYVIYKGNDRVTDGEYDNVLADQYNDMDPGTRAEHLTMDLRSWKSKAVEGKHFDNNADSISARDV